MNRLSDESQSGNCRAKICGDAYLSMATDEGPYGLPPGSLGWALNGIKNCTMALAAI